jgi:hypothetical protein
MDKYGLNSVSCATASFCAAVDWWGSVYTYNGISWSSLDSIDPGYPGLESVSCPTTSFCAAVDYSDAFTYSSLATPKTALKLSAAVVTYGDEGVEHLAVTVSPQHSGTTPTGTMTIKTSSTTLCVIKLSSGKESCTLYAKKLKAAPTPSLPPTATARTSRVRLPRRRPSRSSSEPVVVRRLGGL